MPHRTHVLDVSDSHHYDIICRECGYTDAKGHERFLDEPCLGTHSRDPDKVALLSLLGYEVMCNLIEGYHPEAEKWLEFARILTQITYKPGWYLRAGIETDRMWVQIGVTKEAEISFDPIAGKKVPWRGAKHYLSPHMCRNEIVSIVKHAIDRAEMHEVNEWFRYKKRSIFNPHLDPDALVEVAKYAKNYNTRDNAMTMDEA